MLHMRNCSAAAANTRHAKSDKFTNNSYMYGYSADFSSQRGWQEDASRVQVYSPSCITVTRSLFAAKKSIKNLDCRGATQRTGIFGTSYVGFCKM